MKLIIDVSEEAYGEIVSQVANGITNPLKICIANGTPIPDNATVCVEPTFDWLQNRVELAKAEINNAIESTFCTKDEAIGLGVALNVIDKYFTI